jgi:hypothetical protein
MTSKILAPVERHIAEGSLLSKGSLTSRLYFPKTLIEPGVTRVIHLDDFTDGELINPRLIIDESDQMLEILDIIISDVSQMVYSSSYDSIRPGTENSITVRNLSDSAKRFVAYYAGIFVETP